MSPRRNGLGLVGAMNSLVSGIVDVGYIGWAMVTVRIDHGGGMIIADLLKCQMITPKPTSKVAPGTTLLQGGNHDYP
jgi:hypothetical protein